MEGTTANLETVLAFTRVAQHGSFSAAAKALGLPKSTVSRRVAALEQRLGVRLLHRTTRKLGLTDVGAQYFARCERVIAELEEAERQVMELQATPRGTLRLTTPSDFAPELLARLIAEFQLAHPEVSVVLTATNERLDLVAGGYDLALRAGSLPDSSLVAKKLVTIDSGLYASPEYLARRRTPLRVADLAAHEMIVFGRALAPSLLRLRGPEGQVEIRISGRMACNDFNFVRGAALGGLGIARLPLVTSAVDVRAGLLERVLPEYTLEGSALYALYPSQHHLTPKVRAAIDYFDTRLAALLRQC